MQFSVSQRIRTIPVSEYGWPDALASLAYITLSRPLLIHVSLILEAGLRLRDKYNVRTIIGVKMCL